MNSATVMHLVWGPMGPEMVRRFADAYRQKEAGRDHELVVVFNGIEGTAQRKELEAELDGIDYRPLDAPAVVEDLYIYRWILDRIETDHILYVNSYTRVQVDGWLDLMARHLDDPTVGMVGGTGTYESIRDMPFNWKMPWTLLYPTFPNPHLRTSGFMIERDLGREFTWRLPRSKIGSLWLESSRHSLSAQVRKRGLRNVVAGRDGVAYDEPDWEAARTFRSGEQENLILADNRTDQYADGDEETKKYLRRLAWGHE